MNLIPGKIPRFRQGARDGHHAACVRSLTRILMAGRGKICYT